MEHTIRIGFQEGDDEILSINLPCQPFKVGEHVNLSVDVKNKEKWDVECVESNEYIIESIESYVNVAYVECVHEHVSFSVYVKKL